MVGNASLLVCPSTWHETGGPKTVLEAFAKGTPVIASRLGIMEEVIDHGRTGLHFEAGNAIDLAAQVRIMIADPARLASMRSAARLEFETRYMEEKNYHLLMQIYDRALAASRLRHGGGDRAVSRKTTAVVPTEG